MEQMGEGGSLSKSTVEAEACAGGWWRVGRGSGAELLLWISGFTTRESEPVIQSSAPLHLIFKLGVLIVPTCDRQKMAPQRCPHPHPPNYEYANSQGKGDFAD